MADTPSPYNKKKMPPRKPNYQVWVISAILLVIFAISYISKTNATQDVSIGTFDAMARAHVIQSPITLYNTGDAAIEFTLNETGKDNKRFKRFYENRANGLTSGPHCHMTVVSPDDFEKHLAELNKELDAEHRIDYKVESSNNMVNTFLNWGVFILMGLGLYFIMRRITSAGPGGQIFSIGKSRAALFDAENKVNITFDNVAGLEEAKEEIKEIVDFLKTPGKFTKLGGKIPKGVLLVGPPGTGKTLLAKAVAGEAGVPFFSLSGSDFVEMFVGVGAARVRDLFKQAKEKAPCIVFIDEIDAIGRSRGKGQMPGANDERENTLNSLLVEMDGFATDSGVIIMAATNRPDVLDSALLRPGRFDRQISVDKPDIVGREAIFRVHMGPLKLAASVDARKIAAQTPGFAGAEIANVCNEAALIAARKNKEEVDMQDFQDAIDRVIGGLEKKNKLISPEEKQIVAYHEAGHAVAGWYFEHADPLVKVSIVPRGVAALGYAQYLPKEQFLYTTEQLIDQMCMALGGRAAEDLTFGRISTGALSDLERITKMAYGMVTMYGMNEKLGNISYYDSKASDYAFNKPYSEATAKTIDEEVHKLIEESYQRTKGLLAEKADKLEILAQELLKKEILFQADLETILGPRPSNKETTLQAYLNQKSEQPEPQVDEALPELNLPEKPESGM